ncbi:MAG: site-2 protease family protein [Armatimonadota bacterium]|nr:site-2 protease family protein [Armatimonadota bacterium]
MAIRLGRVFGIPIDIDYSWLLIFGLFTYSVSAGHFGRIYPELSTVYQFGLGLLTTLLFFATLVAHELAHSYVARKSGITISGITLFIFGGVARMKSEPDTPLDEFKMAIAGPAFSIAAALAAWMIAAALPVGALGGVFRYVAAANAIVAVFNLIPGFPLDGGRVLRSAVWAATDDLRLATRAASTAGQAFGWGLIALGFVGLLFTGSLSGIWFMFIGWFLNNAAQSSYRQLLIRRALEDVEVSDVMTPLTEPVDPGVSVDELVRERFLRTHADAYPVGDQTGIRGIVRLEDVRRVPRDQWLTTRVEQIVEPITEQCTIGAGEPAWEAVNKMTDGCPSRVVVFEDGSVVGTVGEENLARLLRTRSQLEMDEAA